MFLMIIGDFMKEGYTCTLTPRIHAITKKWQALQKKLEETLEKKLSRKSV